jgi:ABC-type antimicrobial peptide transport system permease subunit
MSIKSSIKNYRIEYGISEERCPEEDNAKYVEMMEKDMLPPDIKVYTDGVKYVFTKIGEDVSQEEINEFLKFKELEYLKTIKKHTGFFYALAIISLILGAIGAIVMLANVL